MMKRKDDVVAQNTKGVEFLFRKNKVTWAKGFGTLKAGNVVEVQAPTARSPRYRPTHVILATGSVPVELPFLPFDECVCSRTSARCASPRCRKHLIVIGGGVIGLELGSVWRRLGAKVTVVEFADDPARQRRRHHQGGGQDLLQAGARAACRHQGHGRPSRGRA
jgi:dihydrolipoamide dehydrogenase